MTTTYPSLRRLVVLAVLLPALAGCLVVRPGSDEAPLLETTIPYGAVDLRPFVDVGRPVGTTDGWLMTIRAVGADTLMHFEDLATGAFEHAFLRRGNSIYTVGKRGDYLLTTPVQSVVYSVFMAKWRVAQGEYSALQAR